VRKLAYLATFTGKSAEVEASCRFSTHFALLVHLQQFEQKSSYETAVGNKEIPLR